MAAGAAGPGRAPATTAQHRGRASAARAPQAARSGRPGAGGQRAPPCLQPSLLAGYPARKRSPRRRSWSAHPPAAARTLLGIKPAPRLWGRGRASRRSSSAHRPRGFVSAPATTLLRTSPSSLSAGASADHPHVAPASRPRRSPATRAADPRALRDLRLLPPGGTSSLSGHPAHPFRPGVGVGTLLQAVRSLAFHPHP